LAGGLNGGRAAASYLIGLPNSLAALPPFNHPKVLARAGLKTEAARVAWGRLTIWEAL